MDSALASLENKLADVLDALNADRIDAAKMAALELRMRLHHTKGEWEALKSALAQHGVRFGGPPT